MHITTRLDREHEDLLYDLGGGSFPSFFVLDAEGVILARHEEPRPSVAGFAATVARVNEYLDRKAKAKPDDKSAQIDLAILRCELGAIDMSAFEEAVEPLGEPTEAQQAAIRGLAANSGIREMLTHLERERWSDDARAMAGEEFFALHEEDSHPTAPFLKEPFWRLLADHAVRESDRATLERCVRELKALPGDDPKAKAAIAGYEAKLAAMDE